MQPIDALTLHYLAAELDVKLADGKINKIQQSNHHDLLLHIWTGGAAGRQKLYINIHPNMPFVALPQHTDFLTMPDPAPNFCTLLRKHLAMARISRIDTLSDERVLNIHLDNFNELGQAMRWVLSVELMGKRSNLILYDALLETIVACAHGVSNAMSRTREISVGYPYVPPPPQNKPLLRKISQQTWTAVVQTALQTGEDPAVVLATRYAGVGRATLEQAFVFAQNDPDRAWTVLHDLWNGQHLGPCFHRNQSAFSMLPLYQCDADWQPVTSVLSLMEACFVTRLEQGTLAQRQKQYLALVEAQAKKNRKRQAELERADPVLLTALKHQGDILMLAASQGQSALGNCIILPDYDSDTSITIELDPALSLAENAQSYYRRYKKGQTRLKMMEASRQAAQRDAEEIESLRQALSHAQTQADLNAVAEDLIALGWLLAPPKKGKSSKSSPLGQPLKLLTREGHTVWVGRNNIQNDLLVRKLGAPDDLWFHVHHMPGAHVVVQTRKITVSNKTLEEAAMLAAWFSPARNTVNVSVVYTPLRYVRKIPNSYPGHVTYTHEQSLNITPDTVWIESVLTGSA